jgi:hypothetical protein
VKLTYNDRAHSYHLDGKRCKSISAVAKIPDDTFSLDSWRKRQILIGVGIRPELAEQAAAHHDDREILDRIGEEAMSAAKSHQAAARGMAAHRITERIDLAEMIIDSPQARAVKAAWERALAIAGLEIVPDLIERIVVYPDRNIAGRFDRFARRKDDGRIVPLDIKTGQSAIKYPHATVVQLALYANAPLMAGPISRDGGTTEQFEPLPDIDRSIGYVVHMPDDEQVNVVGVDLEAGWRAAQTCFDVLDWRASKDLLLPVTEIPVDSDTRSEGTKTHDRMVYGEDYQPPKPVAGAFDVLTRTDWIRYRLNEIAKLGPDAKELAARYWPANTPYRPPWTDDQIDLLDQALQQVEKEHEAPFPVSDPTKQRERQPL